MKLTWVQPLIGGFVFNEPAVFLPFDPNATVAPPPVTVPGAEGLMCSIKREIEWVQAGWPLA